MDANAPTPMTVIVDQLGETSPGRWIAVSGKIIGRGDGPLTATHDLLRKVLAMKAAGK